MPKKVILTVTNDLVTDQRVNKIATTLSESGYSVTVIGRVLKDSLPLLGKAYTTDRMRLLFTKGALFYAEFNLRIFLRLLFAKVDILAPNDLDTLLGVWLAAKLRGKAVVYDSHEYFTEVPELIENPKAKKVWIKIESVIVPKLKSAMTVCQSIADVYTNKYGTKFSVVRNVPNFSEYPDSDGVQGTKTIIYQGAVNVGRGLELIIEAMPLINDANLLIIGSGDILADLQKKVRDLKLGDRVTFTGRLNYEALRSYTLNADIGISLEENMGLNYYYALPNKLFDYIQCRVPVLASPLPEIQKIVDGYGIGRILDQRTPQALATLANEMLTDANQRQQWKTNATKAGKELCWENEKKTLLEVYKNTQ